jgi:hypothetical protein
VAGDFQTTGLNVAGLNVTGLNVRDPKFNDDLKTKNYDK